MTPATYTPDDLLGQLNDVELKNAPKLLYLAGDPRLLSEGSRVSIVGSRNVSAVGIRRAVALSQALVAHGIIVVSGLARGVDSVAHETAIACGGRTVAVLGTSLERFYPAENSALQQRIMSEHLAVSQFPSGTPPRRQNFAQRNRTMALLSDATVVVEAGEKSGTLHQGWEALRLGRLLLLLESVAANPELSWPKEMIRYGAQVLTRENLPSVLENLPKRTCGEEILF